MSEKNSNLEESPAAEEPEELPLEGQSGKFSLYILFKSNDRDQRWVNARGWNLLIQGS